MCLLANTAAFDALPSTEQKELGFYNIVAEQELHPIQLGQSILSNQTLAQLTKLANQLTMLWEQSCWNAAKSDSLR